MPPFLHIVHQRKNLLNVKYFLCSRRKMKIKSDLWLKSDFIYMKNIDKVRFCDENAKSLEK